MSTLSVVSLATNGYIGYWKDLVISTEHNFFSGDSVTFHIFTDSIKEAKEFAQGRTFAKICMHEIPNLKWPEATLLRYKYISDNAHHLQDDYIIYLDADMKVIAQTQTTVSEVFSKDSITLVQHPGYWRSKGLESFCYYLINPLKLFSDLRLKITTGGLGAWDANHESTAFVSRKHRRKYYCGGIWGGPSSLVTKMCDELSTNIEIDTRNGVMARWHDESHLNKWATNNKFLALSPVYCFESSFRNLRGLSGVIEAVDKGLEAQEAKGGG